MRISSRTQYALRALVRLAEAPGQMPVSVPQIAEAEGLPLDYLEQLMLGLRSAGLVVGTRGHGGGYRLSRPPTEITVGEVLRTMEGPLALVECTAEGYEAGSCPREPECLSRSVWRRLHDAIEEVLDTTTLSDLRASEVPTSFIPEDRLLC